MTSLPALREAAGRMNLCGCPGAYRGMLCQACSADARHLKSALPALLDELEAARLQRDAGNNLYLVIIEKLKPFFPKDDRGLDWDVLPSTLAGLARDLAAAREGTSHDCDIIADGADTEEQLRADLMGQRDAYDILLDHANELERANAALRADIANWPVCDQHKPGLWDGDPPCVICEAHREHAVLAEVRGLLTEIWHSIPSSYDEADPMVQRHARALNALQAWAAKETP